MIRIALLSGLCLATVAMAGPRDYSFKDPKGVNNVQFLLDSRIEPIMGAANGVSGDLKYDPAMPGELKGKIVVASKSVHVLNDRMKMKMHSTQWLDVENFSEITFVLKSAKLLKPKKGQAKNVARLEVKGTFSLRGVTKEVTVEATLTHLADAKLWAARMRRGSGQMVVLRTTFVFKRSEFSCGLMFPSVSDAVKVTVAIVGLSPDKQS